MTVDTDVGTRLLEEIAEAIRCDIEWSNGGRCSNQARWIYTMVHGAGDPCIPLFVCDPCKLEIEAFAAAMALLLCAKHQIPVRAHLWEHL